LASRQYTRNIFNGLIFNRFTPCFTAEVTPAHATGRPSAFASQPIIEIEEQIKNAPGYSLGIFIACDIQRSDDSD
jgi:hypothetical protein